MPKLDVVLVANSPGELSAQVAPVVNELKGHPVRIILVITPCQYSSGREEEFARSISGIEHIIPVKGYYSWLFRNLKPSIDFAQKGVVIFLGGDLFHAKTVAKKLKYPAYAYVQDRIAWDKSYRKFFVPDQHAKEKFSKKIDKSKIMVVGNLMVDSVSQLKKWDPQEKVITFMPGSRKWEIDYMTPLYCDIIQLLRNKLPDFKFQLVSSPFEKAAPIEGVNIISFDKVDNSELVVTIPGTNTARLAARGIPMIVVFPLNNPEVIPLEGFADLIGKVPILGKLFKKWLAKTINKKTKFFALPNQKADQGIVPEIRGIVSPFSVGQVVYALYKNKEKRTKMSNELLSSMGTPGAAKKIWETIRAEL